MITYVVLAVLGCPQHCIALAPHAMVFGQNYCVENTAEYMGYVRYAYPTKDSKVIMMTPGVQPCLDGANIK